MIIMKNSGLLEIDYAEKLLLTIFCRSIQTTATDSGSVDFASLHGCNLLGEFICPWMDGQTFAPAISALPPSMVVVLGQCIVTRM